MSNNNGIVCFASETAVFYIKIHSCCGGSFFLCQHQKDVSCLDSCMPFSVKFMTFPNYKDMMTCKLMLNAGCCPKCWLKFRRIQRLECNQGA